jgi:hypothetical protein
MPSQPRLQAVNGDKWIGETAAPPTAPTVGTDPPGSGGANPPSSGSSAKSQKQRADRSLPTDRLNFDKQVEVLRAIAQMSGNGRRPVTAEDLSAAIGLKGNTGGLSNKFFRDSGWVESAGRGMYAATDPLLEYHRHLNVDAQDLLGARRYLAAASQASWYWETLEPLLDEGGARQTMILHALSKAAGAYEHTPQLLLVLAWLEWLGLVRREGDLLFRSAAVSVHHEAESDSTPSHGAQKGQGNKAAEPDGVAQPDDSGPSGTAESGSNVDGPTETPALVSFSFNVRITAEDAAKLTAEQLQYLLAFAEKLRG